MSPLRVCHLIKGLGRGGAESLLPQTIRGGGGGVSYAVGYFLPWKNALVPELAELGVPVRCFAAGSNAALLARVPAVARWLRAERADLVHAHLPLAGVAARLAGRLAGVPVVYTEHNLQERYHPWTRRLNRLTWGLQERAIAVSVEVAQSIAEHVGRRVPVEVVLNGIEVEGRLPDAEAVEAVRWRWRLPVDRPVVGTVAVMRRQKRLDLWLEAAGRIAAARPDAAFVVVGDGPLRGELEARAAALGLAGRVRFVGLQDDVCPFLAVFDVFLTSSEFEGLPLALLEAMAAGVPVVATRVGGVPEVVRDPAEGALVPFGDPAALAGAVDALLADPERARAVGEAGRRRVARDFGVARMARELEEIYASTLRRAG